MTIKTRFILFAISILLQSTLFCQEIPNGDLEDWEWIGWYDNPMNWTTPNQQILTSVYMDGSPCEGELAMQVKPMAGLESTMGYATLDFPITAIPPQLQFCAKSNVVSEGSFNDTCRVYISFWNGDQELYREVWTNTTSLEEWTEITIPLSQIEPIMDMCRIEVQASYPGTGLGSGSLNTWISVDNFRFEDNTNFLNEYSSSKSSIYPNPSIDGVFHITSESSINDVILYDILGNKIMQETFYSKTYSINEKLKTGVYFLLVNGVQHKLVVK